MTEEGQGSLIGSVSLRDLEVGTRGAGRLLRQLHIIDPGALHEELRVSSGA